MRNWFQIVGLAKTLKFILDHPLNRGRPIATLARFAKWQIESRIRDEVIFDWIEESKLAVRRGMTGATGNIYCGLHEYADMSFLLHLLRPGDLFIDAGANVGSYTVLASRVCGAHTIAFEPDPGTADFLRRNIAVNAIDDIVTVEQVAVGPVDGEVCFTTGKDTTNQVSDHTHENTQMVRQVTLDSALSGCNPTMIKMDLEGYEEQALGGALEVLKNPSVIAIEIETVSNDAAKLLEAFGFTKMYYNPRYLRIDEHRQEFTPSNELYLRDMEIISARLQQAREFNVLQC